MKTASNNPSSTGKSNVATTQMTVFSREVSNTVSWNICT